MRLHIGRLLIRRMVLGRGLGRRWRRRVALLLILLLVIARSHAAPTTQPVAGWDAAFYRYEKPKVLVVEETTPEDEQLAMLRPPPKLPADAPPPKQSEPAKPAPLGPFDALRLRFTDATGDVVTALLCTPREKKGPYPLVIAVHGLTSNKAQMVHMTGTALSDKGFAILALDLPYHGERPGDPREAMNPRDFPAFFRKSVIEVRQLVDIAETRPEIDHQAPIFLLGYSLGSWVSVQAAPADERIKALVLMVGGAHEMPAAMRGRSQESIDARLAITHFAGRPLLMLNGKDDRLVTPDAAKLLFDAAPEPKQQRWYDSGHLLPAKAYEDTAAWAAELVAAAREKPKDK